MISRKDWMLGLASILIGGFIIQYSRQWNSLTAADPAGPGAIPSLVSWGMVIIGVLLIVGALAKGKEETEKKAFMDKAKEFFLQYQSVIYICIISMVYIGVLEHVGYLLATPFLLGGILYVVNVRSLKENLSVSIGATVVLFVVFYYGLQVKLPMGILKGLI